MNKVEKFKDVMTLMFCVMMIAIVTFIIYTLIMMIGIEYGGWNYPQIEPVASYLKMLVGRE